MTLRLDHVLASGHALPAPFLKLRLEAELQRLKLLRKTTGAEGDKLAADWDLYRNKLRALGAGLGERVKNHLLLPLVPMLGYDQLAAADEVATREGKEDGGVLFAAADGSKLRAWAVGRDTDLDAPSKRGRAYRFSPARIAHRVLEQTGEHLGLLTDGTELRILLRDPGRADSHLTLPLERDGGWRSMREVPDSFRLLLALGSPKGVAAVPALIDAARSAQSEVTKKLRQQARTAVERFVQGVYDHPQNAKVREEWDRLEPEQRTKLAADFWREGLILVYRLLFVLKLETDADPARVFSFAATSLWRNTFSPGTALAPVVRKVLDQGADTGGLLEGGLRALFRLFVEGLQSRELTVRPLGGALFGEEAMPLLEGLRWGERAVAHLLDALLWTPANGKAERERVHYGTLDVEDLGRVYEALLELEPGIAIEPMCRLRRAKLEVVVPAAQGAQYRRTASPDDDADEDDEQDEPESEDADDEDDTSKKKGKAGKTKVVFVEEIQAGRFFVRTGLGRKSSGSYYTPQAFVRFLVEETLGPQLQECSPRDNPDPSAILQLKVLDPAMGSGHFLVEACRYLGSALYEACRLCDELASKVEKQADGAAAAEKEKHVARAQELRHRVELLPDPQDELVTYLPSRVSEGGDSGLSQRKAEALCRRLVAVHCLYGVDKNELAVALARLALWLESYAEGLPLTFLDHRLVCGDSLTGPFFEDLMTWPRSGQPLADLMFKGLAQQLETRRKAALQLVSELEASVGRDVQDLVHKAQLKQQLDVLLQPFRMLAAAWSGMVMLGGPGDDGAYSSLAQAVAKGEDVAAVVEGDTQIAEAVAVGAAGVSYDLLFPEVFAAGREGFNAVVGNPPWDRMLPAEKEFLAGFDLSVLDARTKVERKVARERLLSAPGIARQHDDYVASFKRPERLVARRFHHQVVWIDGNRTIGKPDLYRIFLERKSQLVAPHGSTGVLVPSAFHANEGATGVRQLYLQRMRLVYCFSFENKKKLFEIDSRMKFAVVVAVNDPAGTREFDCAFYLHDLEWLFGERKPLRYTLEFVRHTGGELLSLLELRGPREEAIANRLFASGVTLWGLCQEWKVDLGRELNMSDDSHRFTPVNEVTDRDPRDPEVAAELRERGYVPLHEGKTFRQYDDRWGERPRYVVALSALADKPAWVKAARYYRLTFRDIARSTDERTVVFGLMQPGFATGHTAPCERTPFLRTTASALLCMAITNSFAFDWGLRLKNAAHVSMFILNSCAVPRLDATLTRFLAHSSLRLTCQHSGFALLWENQLGNNWRESSTPRTWPVLDDQAPRLLLRSAIDAVVADAYDLTRDQFAYVLSTFKHKTNPEAPTLCLQAFDELQQLGFNAFARKHDPYFDIPLNESLPQPAIDLAIPETAAADDDAANKKRRRQPAGPFLPFGNATTTPSKVQVPTAANRVAESHPAYTTAEHFAVIQHLLRDCGALTSSDAQTATGLDAATIRPLLQRLVAEGHAKIEGQKRGTRYVRANHA